MKRVEYPKKWRKWVGRVPVWVGFLLGSLLCLAGSPKLTPEVLKEAEKLIHQATRPKQLIRATTTLRLHRNPELRKAKWQVWQQLLHRLDEFLQKDLQQYGKEAEELSDEVEKTAATVAWFLGEDEDIPWPWIQSFLEQSKQPLRGILVSAAFHRDWKSEQSVKPFIMETGRECQLRTIRHQIYTRLSTMVGFMSPQEIQQFGKLALRLPDDPVAALEKQIRRSREKGQWHLLNLTEKLIGFQCPIDRKLELWKLCIEKSSFSKIAGILARDSSIPAARLLKEAQTSCPLQAHFFYMALAWRWIDPGCRALWQQAKDQPIAADRNFYTKEQLSKIAQGLFLVAKENPYEWVRYDAYCQLKVLNQELKDPKLNQKIQWIAARERSRFLEEMRAGKPNADCFYLGYVENPQQLGVMLQSTTLSSPAVNRLAEILKKEKDVPESIGRAILQNLEFLLQKGDFFGVLKVLTAWSGPTLAEERKKMIVRSLKQVLRAPNAQTRIADYDQSLPIWTYEERTFREIIWLLTRTTWLKNEDIRSWIQKLDKPLNEYLWFVLAERGDPEAQRQIRRLALEGSRNYIRWRAVEYIHHHGTLKDLPLLEKVKEQDPYWEDPKEYYREEKFFRHSLAAYFWHEKYKEPLPERVWPIRDRAEWAIQGIKQKFEKKQQVHSSPGQSK